MPEVQPPGAIYIDAFDVNGTIRTGLHTGGTAGGDARGNASYAYVDTLLYFNARAGCATAARNATACAALLQALDAQRALRPLLLWDDAAHGRHASWP